jgi:hypothetical protein
MFSKNHSLLLWVIQSAAYDWFNTCLEGLMKYMSCFVFIGAKNTVTILGWFHMGHWPDEPLASQLQTRKQLGRTCIVVMWQTFFHLHACTSQQSWLESQFDSRTSVACVNTVLRLCYFSGPETRTYRSHWQKEPLVDHSGYLVSCLKGCRRPSGLASVCLATEWFVWKQS